MRDPYEVLGVSQDATQKEIKIAYRRIVMQVHPDRASDEAAKHQYLEAVTAYTLLSSPEARAAYDRAMAPINNLADLYQRDEGQRFLARQLPRAPKEPVTGDDLLVVLSGEPSSDGFFDIALPSGSLKIPVSTADLAWAKIKGFGQQGNVPGNLWVRRAGQSRRR